jgi:hypothetical protein
VQFFAQISDFQAFYPYTSESKMYLHNSLYYSVITMTTLGNNLSIYNQIGFGDIYPHGFAGRVVMTSFIMVVALLYSQFFGQL